MRPGKNPTPRPTLDLSRIWKLLDEDPPGKIQIVPSRQSKRGASVGRDRKDNQRSRRRQESDHLEHRRAHDRGAPDGGHRW